jgi:hypothetical protein
LHGATIVVANRELLALGGADQGQQAKNKIAHIRQSE